MKINLLKEVEDFFKKNGYSWDDVKTISVDGSLISGSQFKALADREYDNDCDEAKNFKSENVSVKPITIFMNDNSYFQRTIRKSREFFEFVKYPSVEDNGSAPVTSLFNQSSEEERYVWVVRVFNERLNDKGEGKEPTYYECYKLKKDAVEKGMWMFRDETDEDFFPRDEDGDVLENELDADFKDCENDLKTYGHTDRFGATCIIDKVTEAELDEYNKQYLVDVKIID